MKRIIFCLLFLAGIQGVAQATLINIGTANYNGSTYNLIWDDDNNGNSIVWLDYSNRPGPEIVTWWNFQMEWVAGLGSAITNIQTPGFNVNWESDSWRLPSAGSPTVQSGYNATTSEMGHLYYTELQFKYPNFPSTADLNASVFDNLVATQYWSGTQYGTNWYDIAWYFAMNWGYQDNYTQFESFSGYGIAVRNAQVSESAVPVPGALWLMISGLMGLTGLKRASR